MDIAAVPSRGGVLVHWRVRTTEEWRSGSQFCVFHREEVALQFPDGALEGS